MSFDNFDEIRPYNDDEMHDAMVRICEDEHFQSFAKAVLTHMSTEDIKRLLLSVYSVADYQERVMRPAVMRLVGNPSNHFSCEGVEEYIRRDRGHLFISNHRDIVMDAIYLQHSLIQSGFDTTDISFGDNLMMSPFIRDLGRASKMIKVVRGGPPKTFLRSSSQLSHYIRHSICDKHQSVWIAQRNGRTKNGIDQTEQGLIKMLSLSKLKPYAVSFSELNLTPMAISYRYEPCDYLKVRELYLSKEGPYVKAKNEDFHSILCGIYQPKSEIHLAFTEPLGLEELSALDADKDFIKALAQRIDEKIGKAYHLFDTHYIAYDLMEGSNRYSDRYSERDKAEFMAYMYDQLAKIEDISDKKGLEELFLQVYGNSVVSKNNLD